MKVYENLAPYYDRFMGHINYTAEAEAIYRFLFQRHTQKGKTLDVGCGSGGHLLPLLKSGVPTDGLDYSEGMCSLLKEKLKKERLTAEIHQGDMREFDVTAKYDTIYAFGETVHHLTDSTDLKAFFHCAYRALKPGGCLLFTRQEAPYFEELADYGDFFEQHGEDYLLWHTADFTEKAAELAYTALIQKPDGTYHRLQETHRLAIYSETEIAKAIAETGFTLREDLEELCFSDILEDEPYKHVTVLEKAK